ncbi:MAG: L-2-amino-thiazoline-4-carboxylic acid hydrolase [Cyclobacteriaceae bacterium]|nr:L-2-amino-thiazoline-4-carboxylic acid hydrolase [Cyclobacteriaceae bacterium]
MNADQDYYLKDRKKHLRFCNTLIKGGEKALYAYDDQVFAEEFKKEVPIEFGLLLPHIPYVGGQEPWTKQLLLTAWFIAAYKWMKKKGEPLDKTWKLCSDMLEMRLRKLPKIMRRIMRYSIFTRKQKKIYAKQAVASRDKIYPEGDVFDFKDTNNGFDYTIEITECAKMTFAKKTGAMEFMPYICLIDKLWAEIFNYGLVRKGTLADGFEKCDFNLKKEGKVDVYSAVWVDEWDNRC